MTHHRLLSVLGLALLLQTFGGGAQESRRFALWQGGIRARCLRLEAASGGWDRALDSPDYVHWLRLHEFIAAFGADGLDRLSAAEGGAAFLKDLVSDDEWVSMLLLSGPLGPKPVRVLEQLQQIRQRDPACGLDRHRKTLAAAVALEFGRRDWPADRAWQRYSFYRDSFEQQLLHPIYADLAAWEKRWLAGHGLGMHGEPSSQEWLRDNVKLPVDRYRGACWQLAYRGHNVLGDSVQSWTYYFPFQGSFDTFTEMTRFVGGVCGRLSGYGAGAAVANGIPATTMGEPGHCAYAVRLNRGNWSPAYSLSWKRGIHVALYGKSWHMLVLSDAMLSEEEAWAEAGRRLWQARLHRPSVALAPAMDYAVYHGSWKALPDLSQLKPVATGKADDFDYKPLVQRNDAFAIVYRGRFSLDAPGAVRLATTSDDGSRLYVDNALVVDNDGLHGARKREAVVQLKAGEHDLTVEFFEATGDDGLSVQLEHVGNVPAVRRCYAAAVKAHPLHYPAWEACGQWLNGTDAPREQLDAYAGAVVSSLSEYPEAAWSLASRYAYPGLLREASPEQTLETLLGFHRALDGWGPSRWNVEAALKTQAKSLGDEPEAFFRFAGGLVDTHAASETYLGPVLTWAYARAGKHPNGQERFFDMVKETLVAGRDGVRNDAILAMCSKAIRAAEDAGDEQTFRAVAKLVSQISDVGTPAEPAFGGELLSAGAFVRFSSVSSRWDGAPYKHCFLPGPTPGFFHTNEEDSPWVALAMPHFGEISGIEIVNRPGQLARAVPLQVAVSEDGETWEEVALLTKARGRWLVDLQGRNVRARHVRARKQGRGFLHLINVRVYGKRAS